MEPSSTIADLLAGFISGTVSTLAVHPIDTVLTRYQATDLVSTSKTVGSVALAETRSMAATLGVMSLWRGAPALIGAAPFQNACLMAGYGVGRRWSSVDNEENDNTNTRYRDIFVGGVVGGIAQCFVASPAELIKVKRQVCDLRLMGKKSQNISAGFGATLLRDGIPHGVWFASYEWCKNSTNNPLVSGAFAATVAWIVGYPFDVIKTRIQAGRATGVWDATRDLITFTQNGERIYLSPSAAIQRLWSGLELKLARSIPASAIGFLVYEYALKLIESRLKVK